MSAGRFSFCPETSPAEGQESRAREKGVKITAPPNNAPQKAPQMAKNADEAAAVKDGWGKGDFRQFSGFSLIFTNFH